jgi:hypothetical protein
MADAVIPSDPTAIANTTAATVDLTNATIAFNQAQTNLNKTYEDFNLDQTQTITNGKLLIDVFNKAGDELKSFGSEIVNGGKNQELFNDNLTKFATVLTSIKSLTSTGDIFKFSGATDQFGTLKSGFDSIKANWGELGKFLPATLKNIANNFGDNAVKGQQLERELVNMLSSGGNLNRIFSESGELTGNLATQSIMYAESLAKVGDASGMTLGTVAAYASKLNQIPGFMTANINTGDDLVGTTSALTAAMKVLSGSGQDFNTMLRSMGIAYETLGNAQGKVTDGSAKGLTLFSTMVQVSKDLNLRFSDTESFLTKVANQFRLVGDNTEGATRVLSRFMDGLRNTGLTSKASLDVIGTMVEQLGKLTTSTKAFISLRAGGPGGLQGAAQIEQLLRQGKVDQVMGMVEQSLRQQFGGRIVTQAQAATNQQDAATFTRQRMLLQSGAFGALTGGDQDKATHLLEAMAAGNRGEVVKAGQEALKTTVNQGNNLQAATNTILTNVANFSERTAIATQLTALHTAQTVLNQGNTDKNMVNAEQKRQMRVSGGETVNTALAPDTTTNFQTEINEMIKKSMGDLVQAGPVAKEAPGKIGTMLQTNFGKGGELVKNLNTTLQEDRRAEQIRKNTPDVAPQNPPATTTPRRPAMPQRAPTRTIPVGTNIPAPQPQTQVGRGMRMAMAAPTAQQTTTPQVHRIEIGLSDDAKKKGLTVSANVIEINPTHTNNRGAASGQPSMPPINNPLPTRRTNDPGY